MADVLLTINGSSVTVPEGTTILDASRRQGIEIPTLCYLEQLGPIGACRLCVVEVEGSRLLVASCHTPVAPKMVVQTHSPKVIETRRVLVELMLASHPESCLVCDKCNICELRKLAADLDIGLPRFRLPKHYYPMDDVSPYLVRDLSKCILCRRCVAGCLTIAKQNFFAIGYRGFNSKIVVDCDEPINKQICQDCDVCVSLCPTGALCKPATRRERKNKRPLIIKG
jgi:NADH-quinone oxidoreductase subunit G